MSSKSKSRATRSRVESLETRQLFAGGIPAVPTPAAHWALDENNGPTAFDSSGNNHNATLGQGVSHVAGNVGTRAVGLNGSAGAVLTATGPVVDTSTSFTASAWVDLASVSGFQTVLSIAGTNVAGFFLQLRSDTGTFAFARLSSDSTTGATTYVSAPTAPVAGTWYHIVGVDDVAAGTLSLYVDGQSVGSTAFAGGWKANGNTLIGHGFYNGGQVDYVNGSIDDVQLFSSALSAAQVAALDQPAYYPFDEATGTTANDYSGHGHPLTLNAGASWGPGHVGSNSLAVNGTATGNATYASAVLNTAQPFSVSAWVYLNSNTGTQTFASIDGTNVSGFELQLRSDTGKFAFTRAASDATAAAVTHADGSAAPSTGVWYNLIGVANVATGKLQLYVNGVLQSTANYTNPWQATGATVVGGGKSAGARADFANGSIDDVHFYNSPLSASAANYIGTGGVSTINVSAGSTGITVAPNLFGAFMEDINYGGEGGIYDDEVRNSGFNDSTNPLNGWSAVAAAGVAANLSSDTTTGPTTALTASGKLTITSGVSATARAGISNSGYFGVAVAPSTAYSVAFYSKASAGFTGPLTVDLESTAGVVYASATINSVTSSWAKYTATLTTTGAAPTSSNNLFVISTTAPSANGATLWFGATYVFPPSYLGANNHLRVDLMQKLAALKPGIFRVPGGNYLEGNTYDTRFNWSQTIGPIENRPGHYNSAWGYWSTDGMGLDEYLQMAEEVGAQPLLAVYAGYTLNGSSDTGTTLTNDVADAVNEIHYVLDPVTTTWGALRAANGHAAPYNVHYVEIGNEDFFSSTYVTRYPLFYNAIHAAFPQLQLIATSTNTGGSPYDVIDDHDYQSPAWFEANSGHYDNYSRTSNKVFVGEYAAQSGTPTNDMNGALGDASWLLGLERDSDVVTLSSYAPIWANVNSTQWATNLIGFNATSSYGSPSYYAQLMLNNNRGTTVVADSVSGANGLQTLVTRSGSTYYLTVVNPAGAASAAAVNLSGTTSVNTNGSAITLVSPAINSTNSITNPAAIVPVTSAVSGLGANFSYTFPAYSVTILEFTATVDTPTVQTPAAATPSPVTGTTTNLSALGADVSGESNLTYTWTATGPGAVTYSANGTNGAKSTVATFTAAGTYTFTATILNAPVGTTVSSAVTVVVNSTPSGLAISPGMLVVAAATDAQFSAGTVDQFGNPINSAAATWTVLTGGGSISPQGVYTAPTTGGTATIRAAFAGGASATATITVAAPVALYRADASTGATLTDSSANGNNGTLTGAAGFGPGVSGNALALSGGSALLPTGIVAGLNNFTIAAWVNVSTLANWDRVFDFGTGTTNYMFLSPDAGGTNAIRFAITTGSGEQRLDGPALAANTWTHLAVTLSGTVATLYVNGVAVATNTAMTLDPSSLGTTNQNYLGDSQFAADPALMGSIDDFRIYPAALSPQQVALLARPQIVVPPAATPLSADGTAVNLSVLAADVTAGESALTYTWATTAGVTFSTNGTNGAKNTTATFAQPGTYTFTVTAVNPVAGLTTTSSVTVTAIPTIYAGTTGADTYALRISPADPSIEQVFINVPETSTPTYTVPLSQLSSLTFDPAGGDGSLTVDFTNGDPIPAGGIIYTGGPNPAANGDLLRIVGPPAGGLAFSVNGSQVSFSSSTITYATLRSIEFDLLGGSNALTQTSQPSAPVVYNAGPGNNALNVDAGIFTFTTDPQIAGGNLTVNDNGAVVFGAGTPGSGFNVRHLAALDIGTGASVTLVDPASHSDRTLLVVGSLSINGTGRLDLGGNDADIAAPNLAALTALLSQGFSNGTWGGPGITSSTDAADNSRRTAIGLLPNTAGGTFDGTTPAATDVLLKSTYFGDANLDGKVDGSDYAKIDNGYLTHATGWQNGDFNYDGVVDGSDYTLIDNGFNRQAAPMSLPAHATALASARKTSPATTDPAPTPFAPSTRSPFASDWDLTSGDILTGRRKRSSVAVDPTSPDR